MNLWPHQQRGLSDLRKACAEFGRVLVVAPTAAGKTRVAGAMCAGAVSLGNTALFIVHVTELVDQTVKTFREIYGLRVGIIQASREADPGAPIHVGTIQTLGRREVGHYGIVAIDEVHMHVGTATIEKVIAANQDADIVGWSATPWRLDGHPMGSLFRTIVPLASYSELIGLGILVSSRVFGPSRPDLSRVHTRDGEFDPDETEEAINKPELVADIATTYTRLGFTPRGHRPGVVFAHSAAHSIACRDALRAAGHRAEHLGYQTPKAVRREMIEVFKAGEIDVLCNQNILTAGFDYPELSYVADASPTQSLARYMQRIGRGMRSAKGKKDLIVADHSGNVFRHGFAHADRTWTLEEAKKRVAKASIPPLRTCPSCFAIFLTAPTCPECGYNFPIVAQVIRQRDGELREINSAPTIDERKSVFEELCRKAVSLRLGRGFVIGQYRAKFSMGPPRFEWPAFLPDDLAKKRLDLERFASWKGYSSQWVDLQMQLRAARSTKARG